MGGLKIDHRAAQKSSPVHKMLNITKVAVHSLKGKGTATAVGLIPGQVLPNTKEQCCPPLPQGMMDQM